MLFAVFRGTQNEPTKKRKEHLTATVERGKKTIVSNAMERICELSRFISCDSPVLVLARCVLTLDRFKFVRLSWRAKWFQTCMYVSPGAQPASDQRRGALPSAS